MNSPYPPNKEVKEQLDEILQDYTDLIKHNVIHKTDAQDHQNVYFCYEKENCVVMDNHRCALWHWIHKIDDSSKYKVLHIDTHYDLADLKHKTSINKAQLEAFSFLDYLNYKNEPNDKYLYFLWANYIQPFLEHYDDRVIKIFTIVNEDESIINSKKNLEGVWEDTKGYDGLNTLENIFESSDYKWIINLDIDFFFHKRGFQLYSNEYIQKILHKLLSFKKQSGSIFTIALSPGCCGNWDSAIRILKEMKKIGLV